MVDYLGNKRALVPEILDLVRAHVGHGGFVVDAFCGTATVSGALSDVGYRVHANDLLPLCSTWASARLLTGPAPAFAGLVPLLGDLGDQPYLRVVEYLGQLAPEEGWVTRVYSPRSRRTAGVERRYLTVRNAQVVDAVRNRLRAWGPHLTAAEQALLRSTLVSAVVAVSNVAGTYGCYLKEWKQRALDDLRMQPLRLGGITRGHVVTCSDAERVVAETPAELVYADPPYTKRQYAAYYHLLNTLVGDDDPVLTGSTGLPAWRTWTSDWCYTRRAAEALDRLAAKTSAPVLVLSYSSDGHVPHEQVVRTLSTYGDVSVVEVERPRYRSSRLPHRSPTVLERLYVMSR